ncbi:hypothetical protein GIA99_23720 [Escherichia coli]|nr:hypothetical protein [Escherichia coli]EFB3582797.1 hypothetical protein [Escherichia coli]EFF9709374.1 hypothetical protein [Escherichia coli]
MIKTALLFINKALSHKSHTPIPIPHGKQKINQINRIKTKNKSFGLFFYQKHKSNNAKHIFFSCF